MALTITHMDGVYCLKGNTQTSQISQIKCFFLEKLKKEEQLLVNLCQVQDDDQEISDMLYRLKMSLLEPSRLDFYGHAPVAMNPRIRHLDLTPLRTLEAA